MHAQLLKNLQKISIIAFQLFWIIYGNLNRRRSWKMSAERTVITIEEVAVLMYRRCYFCTYKATRFPIIL